MRPKLNDMKVINRLRSLWGRGYLPTVIDLWTVMQLNTSRRLTNCVQQGSMAYAERSRHLILTLSQAVGVVCT